MQYVGSNQATKIFCRDSDGNVPTYVGDNVVGNLRRVMKSVLTPQLLHYILSATYIGLAK